VRLAGRVVTFGEWSFSSHTPTPTTSLSATSLAAIPPCGERPHAASRTDAEPVFPGAHLEAEMALVVAMLFLAGATSARASVPSWSAAISSMDFTQVPAQRTAFLYVFPLRATNLLFLFNGERHVREQAQNILEVTRWNRNVLQLHLKRKRARADIFICLDRSRARVVERRRG